MPSKEYSDGYLAGKVESIEDSLNEHKKDTQIRFEKHEKVALAQSKILWMLIGAWGLVQIYYSVKGGISI